jgi:hypothetical protein
MSHPVVRTQNGLPSRRRQSFSGLDFLSPETPSSSHQQLIVRRPTTHRHDATEKFLRPEISRSASARRPSPQPVSRRTASVSSFSSSASDDEFSRPFRPRKLSLWDSRPHRPRQRALTLCQSCKLIDFDRCLRRHMRRPITLGRRKKLREDCPFCRLVIDCILQSGQDVAGDDYILLDNKQSWRSSVVYAPYDGQLDRGYSTFRDARAAAKTSGMNAHTLAIRFGNEKFLGYIQYIAAKDAIKDRRFFGRRVDQHHADLDLICSWLPRCRKIHGRSCGESGEASKRRPNIRVIDTWHKVIIRAAPGCDYVALSYCWGDESADCKHVKTTRKDIRWDNFGSELPIPLPSSLPQTIEDTIFVTRQIGLRYLWVDALCIVQDSETDKHTQILRMDGIYSSAVLTIAAASGDHANVGLAGISRPRKVPQRTEEVDGLLFALPLPDYTSLLWDPSLVWNSRGWTFQEKVLSKRLLLFTDYQVYFQCSNMVWCEDTALETDRCSASTKKMWRPLRWAADRQKGQTDMKDVGVDLGNYMSVIEQFTPRELRDRKDGVHAITGVLATLQSEMGSFHCGLPTDYFAPALLWRPVLGSIATRLNRPEAPFPSWSWARWKFSEGCSWQRTNLKDTYLAHVSFLLKAPLYSISSSVPMSPLRAPASEPQWSVRSPDDSVTSRSQSSVIAMPQSSVIPQPDLTPSDKRLINDIGLALYFKTMFLTNIQIGSMLDPSSAEDMDDCFCQYELCTKSGQVIGDMRMLAKTRHWFGQKSVEFITICWSKGYDGPSVSSDFVPFTTHQRRINYDNQPPRYETIKTNLTRDEYPVANVMLVRWIGNVAERVAVGNIVRRAWLSEEIQGETRWIVLG